MNVTIRVGPCSDGERSGEQNPSEERSSVDGFFVEDNGSGIPDDEKGAVFEAGHTTAAGGTGYGLCIVSEIAAAHDWAIKVVDGRDGGARFEITGIEAV